MLELTTEQDGPGAAPTSPGSDAQVLHRLRAVLWRGSREVNTGSAEDNLSPSQASVLTIIHMQGPISLQDLVASEGLNPTMGSRIASELVRRKWVKRAVDAADARAVLLTVTAEGAEVSERVRSRRNAALEDALASLPVKMSRQIESALPALELLVQRLDGGGRRG